MASVSVASRFGKQIHKPPVPDKSLAMPFAKVGIEFEVENCPNKGSWLVKHLPNWKYHVDDSLRNSGMEFTSPGGLVGVGINEAIDGFCAKAKELKFSEGYPRAGIHFHLDCTDMNEKSDTQLLNMALAYMLFEHVFFSYAGEWRRACGFCDALLASQEDFSSISSMLYNWKDFNYNNLSERNFSKYAAVNFLPLSQFGTIEFRHLPTTFDSERIKGWLNLCLCMKRYGMNIDDDPVDTLLKHGPEILTKIVFRGYEKLIKPHVDFKKVWAAMPEVMALKLMRKTMKLDPWDDPDNPMLADKRVVKKEKPAKTKKASAAIEPVAPRRGPGIDMSEDEYLAAIRRPVPQWFNAAPIPPPLRRR